MYENQAIFPSAELSLIKAFMQAEGHSAEKWLLGTGIPINSINEVDTLVSLNQFDIIYRNVFRLIKTKDVGFRLGQSLNISRWGVLSLAFISSSTLGIALEIANQHRVLVRSRFDLSHDIQGGQVKIVVRESASMPFPVNIAFGFEMLIGSLQRQVADLLNMEFSFDLIQLQYPAPSHHKVYQQFCNCRVEFNANENALWVPLTIMKRPLDLENSVVKKQAIQISEGEMLRVAKIQEGDIAWLVRTELSRSDLHTVNLERLSQSLDMSPRTLRRKLKNAGTSYREIYQQSQLQMIIQALVNHKTKLSEIAVSCGFSSVAGLRQAFIRWTGIPLSQYRQQLTDRC